MSFDQLPTAQVMIEVRAPVLENVQVGDELVRHVAWNGATFNLGTLSLHSDGSGAWLQFSYSLFGETVTQQIINQVVAVVGQTADQLAQELQPSFGGTFVYPWTASEELMFGKGKSPELEQMVDSRPLLHARLSARDA